MVSMQLSMIFKIFIFVFSFSLFSHQLVYCKEAIQSKETRSKEKSRPKPKGPIRITSQSLRVEKKKQVSYFEGNVIVKSPQYMLSADKVTAYFDDRNAIIKVFAKGNVKLTSGKRVGTAKEATYIEKDGLITLSGNAKIKDPQEGSMTAQEILYYLDDERVVAKGKPSDPTVIIYGLDGKNEQKSDGK